MTADISVLKKRIAEGVKLVPFIGPVVGYVIEHWGVRETVFFILGAIGSALIVYVGNAPEFLIRQYRTTTPPAAPKDKPTRVDVSPLKSTQKAFEPYMRWVEQEADNLKGQQLIKGFQSCLISSQELSFTTDFSWLLKVDAGYQVSGWAFKQNQDGSFIVLEASKLQESLIRFKVPKGILPYKLLAVLLISWKSELPAGECIDLISSSTE